MDFSRDNKAMRVQHWAVSDKGNKRDSNQDSYLVNESLGLFVVADGMGGHSGGEVASSLAVQTLESELKIVKSAPIPPREKLFKSYERASIRIFDKAATESPELTGMGTTMVGCFIEKNRIYISNVGDSRCYLYSDQYLWQLTEDHSLMNEQIRSGLLKPENSATFTGRNVITRSVGYERMVHPDILDREIKSGETYLLCSDGLTGMVSDQKMAEIFNSKPLQEVALALIQAALANGGDDNVTALLIHFPK
ncbi:MAG: Stp1/IreP family PP2C-type Ser/Thr phosphatase [Bdellovibrionales bacterium]